MATIRVISVRSVSPQRFRRRSPGDDDPTLSFLSSELDEDVLDEIIVGLELFLTRETGELWNEFEREAVLDLELVLLIDDLKLLLLATGWASFCQQNQ